MENETRTKSLDDHVVARNADHCLASGWDWDCRLLVECRLGSLGSEEVVVGKPSDQEHHHMV
jgi:hypothetical protein